VRRPFVAGNWKMHNTLSEARALMRGLRDGVAKYPPVDVAVCPPFTLLYPMCKEIDGTAIKLGAQNVYCEPKGAFTGEISPTMLRDAGCTYVIIGHSERRQHFGESGELLRRKVAAAIEAGLSVIYCVGETIEQRKAGRTTQVVEAQLTEAVSKTVDPARLTIAYEPVWAIGTGLTATAEQAEEVHAFLRGVLAGVYGKPTADGVRIQYGGSVKPDNAVSLMACPNVDGALVGGACLAADSFLAIIAAAASSAG